MIHSISNNFGAGAISLKCHNSSRVVVIEGVIEVDPTNADYLSASQLEITFDTSFDVVESEISACVLFSGENTDSYCTIVKCRLAEGNKLVIEKLSIYDNRSPVKIYLGTAFVAAGNTELLASIENKGLDFVKSDISYSFKLADGINYYEDGWGLISGYFSSFYGKNYQNLELTFADFPTGVDSQIIFFQNCSYPAGAKGSFCWEASLKDGLLSLYVENQYGETSQSGAFIHHFYVRETEELPESI